VVILILKSRIPGLLKIMYQFAEEDFVLLVEAGLQHMNVYNYGT
jgi:hypothetical protein